MTDDLAQMVSDGDKEALDRYTFASLPSVRSQFYILNSALYTYWFDDTDAPF